jgi:large subunit ribosomal protein L25
MAEHEIAVELRESSGKGVARKLRAAGRIPGVYYSKDGSQAISLEPLKLERLLASSAAGLNTLIDLRGGGRLEGKRVLIKELQRDPVRGGLLHADLYAVDLQVEVEVEVPIHLVGTPKGVELDGGILDHALRELQIECLPTAIPEEFQVDVSALEIGDSLHVEDIVLPPGVKLISDPELSIASVVAPKVEEEPEVAAEELPEGEAEAAPTEEGDAEAKEKADAEGGGDD